ncbi:hypothetical protein V6N13_062082 [Hibiscus sabdariffa]|uniref:Uncharacterized protein n=2 Tax=Hibiscus sabdariffa TaxID=183260 RepID=A0ABR2PF97_9ROSI
MESRKRKNVDKQMPEDVFREYVSEIDRAYAELNKTSVFISNLVVEYKKQLAETIADMRTQLMEPQKATKDELALLNEDGEMENPN